MDIIGYIILIIYGILFLDFVIGLILKIIERVGESKEDKYKDIVN